MKATSKDNTSQLDNKDSSIKPDIKKVNWRSAKEGILHVIGIFTDNQGLPVC